VATPIGLWRSARITPEGYWLGAEDVTRAKDYERYAVARARDHGLDARKLYNAGMASDRLRTLLNCGESLYSIVPTLLKAENAA
jgi:hypothetical protein